MNELLNEDQRERRGRHVVDLICSSRGMLNASASASSSAPVHTPGPCLLTYFRPEMGFVQLWAHPRLRLSPWIQNHQPDEKKYVQEHRNNEMLF